MACRERRLFTVLKPNSKIEFGLRNMFGHCPTWGAGGANANANGEKVPQSARLTEAGGEGCSKAIWGNGRIAGAFFLQVLP